MVSSLTGTRWDRRMIARQGTGAYRRPISRSSCGVGKGPSRIRTGDGGFAIRCLTAWLRGQRIYRTRQYAKTPPENYAVSVPMGPERVKTLAATYGTHSTLRLMTLDRRQAS